MKLLIALLFGSLAFMPATCAQTNVLRNGSFEGGTLYWHQVAVPDQTLVKNARVGEYALRIAKGNVMSAPFVADRGQPMTVSFFVKGEKPGRVGVQMPPSAREPGTKAKRLWVGEAEQTAEITTEWKRVSFTWLADVPQDGFWPNPHYLVQIGGYDHPILVDGVTVTVGKEPTPEYVPRYAVEVVAECTNLPGYAGAAGNLFKKGAEVELVAHVSNTTSKEQVSWVSFSFHDYEGNEGWAFTNTAVDEPIACTHLTAAQSTNAHAASVAEMTVAGQEKTILFHTGYETHGMSFWDYRGPGTCLWDWYDNPLPLVPMWNVLNHHIGISDVVGFVRPPGANLCIFQDLRNGRGVILAYADGESKADVKVELPLSGLTMEDIMGNASPATKTLRLSKTGRVVLLYDGKTSGAKFLQTLESLDRKNASFATAGSTPTWKLPPTREGKTKGESDGSIAMADGKPVWKLEQLWPADWKARESFRPMVWAGTDWNVKEGGFGGQPGAKLVDGALSFGTRAPHGAKENERFLRTAGLTFIAPKAGRYSLAGTASAKMWDSKNNTKLLLLKKTKASVEKLAELTIPNGGSVELSGQSCDLAVDDELTLLPQIDGMFAGGDCNLQDFSITLGGAVTATQGYRLPAAWEGQQKGSASGNPISASGKPIWRLDRLYPEDAIMAANYAPMVWQGTRWAAPDHTQAGHPSAEVGNGKLSFAGMGPWNGGDLNLAKVPVLVFIAPDSGTYKVTGSAMAKPWEGGAKSFPLSFRKKDAQRAAELSAIQLPRDGTAVPFSFDVEMTVGRELLFLPLMQGIYNTAANFTIESLSVERK